MKSVIIYHNPRCSKSRQTLQLIEEKDYAVTVIEYLKTPPDKATLLRITEMLGISVRDLMRDNEKPYKELALNDSTKTDEDLLEAMVTFPILIQRPIVIVDDKVAVIGRPPENVHQIL